MKVKQESGFNPVVITLETEQEVRDLYNIMNCAPAVPLINCGVTTMELASLKETQYALFDLLDEII